MGGRTPRLSIEHLDDGAFVASGFDTLPAQALLDFCEQHGLNCEVTFTRSPHVAHSSFQVHFFYAFPDTPPPPTKPTDVDLASLCLDDYERGRLSSITQSLPPGIGRAHIVTRPRVLKVCLFPSAPVCAADLDSLQRLTSVLCVRLGGLGQCIELTVRRASRFAKRQTVSPKRARRTSASVTRTVRRPVRFETLVEESE